MISTFYNLFQVAEFYPNNLAETGIALNTIYHGVNKNLLTGLISYTNPFFGVIAECHQIIEDFAYYYLSNSEGLTVNITPETDDTFILSESVNSLWFWWSEFQSPCGSIGRVSKQVLTLLEFREELMKNIEVKETRIPTPDTPCFTGNYLTIPVLHKKIVFL